MKHITPRSKYFAAATALVALSGCGKTSSQSEVVPADSISTPEQQILTMLPDTAYQSVESVKFTVELVDSVSGELISLIDPYASTPGNFTFRKGQLRQADFGGSVKGTPSDIVVDWTFETDYDLRQTSVGTWGGGTGWTGQPVLVEWPDSLMTRMKGAEGVLPTFGQQEIIFGSLASKVYFVNYQTGEASRSPIDVNNPIKGSVSLDPSLNGNLYVGHGAPAERPFGALVIDLFAHKIVQVTPEDPKAPRHWGAYDSSAIRAGQFMIRPGENGRIYKFTVAPGELKLHSALSYAVDGMGPGIESSMAVYRNYGYTADNAGNLLCINLNTMRPVWLYRLGDDSDATPVVNVEDGVPYVYAASEIDRQGVGTARFAKINGLTGEPVWEQRIEGCRFDIDTKHFDGGFYATPLLGSGNCSNLIFANCVLNLNGQNGEMIAFERETGNISYRLPLKYYAWSSPVAFLNENDEMFIVNFDCSGYAYLIDAAKGNVIISKLVGANFESSAVVKDNTLVIGSRGNSVMRLSIK